MPRADTASSADSAVLLRQLGREPRLPYAVALRCPEGLSAVIETADFLSDGTPFPTRYWLTCPSLVFAVARAESVPGWADGRDGSHKNCLHREVAEALVGGGADGAGAAGSEVSPAGEPAPAREQAPVTGQAPPVSDQAAALIAGWECTHRRRCTGEGG